jgi:hypothetical protein
MPTSTGWPAASWAEIQDQFGFRLMMVECPGILRFGEGDHFVLRVDLRPRLERSDFGPDAV